MTGRPAMGTQVRRTLVTQIGVEAATLIPPLAYRAVMMVVIAIPVVVGAVLVRTARPVHTY